MSPGTLSIAALALAGGSLLTLAAQDPAPEPETGAAPVEREEGKQDAPPDEAAQVDTTAPIADIPIEELSGADRDAAEALLHARLEEQYFLTSDRDGNGWVSFREARVSLRIDRGEYALFDSDADGRIVREEFGVRYRASIESTGAFRPPAVPKRFGVTPAGAPLSFDFNGTGALELAELRAFLADRGIHVPAEALLGYIDKDGSGALEAEEIAAVLEVVALFPPEVDQTPPPHPQPEGAQPPLAADVASEPPTSVEELFGTITPREMKYGTTMLPPRIVGPVPHFRRLDHDDDGYITTEDLLGLLSPARVGVRAGAVIASIDRDGDERLSRAEFEAALERH